MGSRPAGRRTGSTTGRRSASPLSRQHLSKLETGAAFRGSRRAASLPSSSASVEAEGRYCSLCPRQQPMSFCCRARSCALSVVTEPVATCAPLPPLIVFFLKKRCSPDQPMMPWARVRLHRHGHRPARPRLGGLAVAGTLQLLLSPSLARRVSALKNAMSDKGSSMDGKTDIVNGKGAGGDRSPCAWGLPLGRLTALSAPRRQLVQQPGGDVS